jgi:hypothetical protein
MPFRRILVKTRSSTSFSSELKDFIGPFDFFSAPAVNAETNVPMYCGKVGVSTIKVTNALPASVYTWSTVDGHFVYPPDGTSVTVDKPGTYVVTQQLLDGCSSYASDTVVIWQDVTCKPLDRSLLDFNGTLVRNEARLRWLVSENKYSRDFTVQRSTDGKTFQNIHTVARANTERYNFTDAVESLQVPQLYYRLAMRSTTGMVSYSPVVRLQPAGTQHSAALYPNPATETVQLAVSEPAGTQALIEVFNAAGTKLYATRQTFSKGHATVTIDAVRNWAPGIYLVRVETSSHTSWLKLVIAPKGTSGM